MLEVPIYNPDGKKVDTMQVDEALFGGEVNVDLVKQAVVAYQANTRQGSAKNKNRSEIVGTTSKMYRQKGTGHARHGDKKANILRGGGRAFPRRPKDFSKKLPRKMRRAALYSAILAKMLGENLMIVDGLSLEEPKTRQLAGMMKNLKINRSCLLALADRDSNVYLSSRNLPDLTVRITGELHAHDVATRQKMLVTSEAMKILCGQEKAS